MIETGLLINLKKEFSVLFCFTLLNPFRVVIRVGNAESENFIGRQSIVRHTFFGEVFRSPFAGMITRNYYDNYEVALKGETIMAIFRAEDFHIKGFFEQSDLKYLRSGDKVTIEFQDSTKVDGKIARLYYATLPLPPEFQKKYEPTHRSIVADIIPESFKLISEKKIEKLSATLWVRKNFR